jgi:hypothetical protein
MFASASIMVAAPDQAPVPITSGSPQILPELLLQSSFQPPSLFAGQLGAYRSPLIFEDGTPVVSPDDWPRRRAELLKQWHALMGPWPPVLEHPKLEVLSATNRAGVVQQRVRLQIAPDQAGEGWLLTPPGVGPFPAVLVVYYEPETSVGLSQQPLRDFGWLHALIAPRPFLVSGGAEDPPSRWIALNHALAVNRFLGFTNRVGMTQRESHTPTEASNAELCAFFQFFLAVGSAPDHSQ